MIEMNRTVPVCLNQVWYQLFNLILIAIHLLLPAMSLLQSSDSFMCNQYTFTTGLVPESEPAALLSSTFDSPAAAHHVQLVVKRQLHVEGRQLVRCVVQEGILS